MAPRRSKRLLRSKTRETRKLLDWGKRNAVSCDLTGSETEESDNAHSEQLLLSGGSMTPSTNNFIKVHNSYNRDRGINSLDCYETDFIDDSPSLRETVKKKRTESRSSCSRSGTKRCSSAKKKLLVSSSESDDSVTGMEYQDEYQRKKRILVPSSDDDDCGTGGTPSDPRHSHRALKDDEEDEDLLEREVRSLKRKVDDIERREERRWRKEKEEERERECKRRMEIQIREELQKKSVAPRLYK